MKLRVGKKYLITTYGKVQFVLYRISKKGQESKNPGEEHMTVFGYYADFQTLIHDFPNKALLNSDAESLADAVKEVQDLGRELREAMRA